jgi:regulator of PEP synthase PpsR (kinase-PPPase family)
MMATGHSGQDTAGLSPIYIVSGGTGASGERLVQTVLVQFPECHIPLVTINHVRQIEQIERVVAQAAGQNGTIVHTLIDDRLRRAIKQLARKQGVATIDLMGDLLARLTQVLGQNHLNQPGRYRHLNQGYFERIAAIDFALAHDDGQNRQDWPEAEIVLVGVSRTGKTPLSIYLSVLGWRVANVPLIAELPLPEPLWQLDRRRRRYCFGTSLDGIPQPPPIPLKAGPVWSGE